MNGVSEPRDHFVYRAWDAEGRLLYIGLTSQPERRYIAHKYSMPWFEYLARYTRMGPFTKDVAADLERRAIAAENSYYNGTYAATNGQQRRWDAAYDRHRKALGSRGGRRQQKWWHETPPTPTAEDLATAEVGPRGDPASKHAEYLADRAAGRFRDHGPLTRVEPARAAA
jgi:predicted GIY-YIG superfamily endonuclease